jgi:hypothetical protein
VAALVAVYVLQAFSSLLFFADAVLYLLSWRAGLAAASGGGSGGKGAVAAEDDGSDGARGGCADAFAWAHALNVLPAFVYAACGAVSLALFGAGLAEGRAIEHYGANRDIRGRLIAGAEPPEIEVACIISDWMYLLCALMTTTGWWRDLLDGDEADEGDEAGEGDDAVAAPKVVPSF